MSDSVRPQRRQPIRLLCSWDSPGKNTGVGCHFLLQCVKVKSLSRVQLLATPWTAAYQAPPPMGFSRQEYCSGVPLPSQLDGTSGKETPCQCRRCETQVQSLSEEDPLGEEMVTYSIILAWRIPWTEEPGRLRSIGSQRVGHD